MYPPRCVSGPTVCRCTRATALERGQTPFSTFLGLSFHFRSYRDDKERRRVARALARSLARANGERYSATM